MHYQEFDRLIGQRLKRCERVLCQKSEEYSRGGERLHNFYTAARMKGETPEQALWGMAMKHIVSVADIVNDTMEGKVPDKKLLDEKIGDWINYGLLLEGLLEDRRSRMLGADK